MSVAPFDVRQGNFVGAGVNTVTRSGTNRFTGSVLLPVSQRVVRRQGGQAAWRTTRARSTRPTLGEWFGGPIFKNKLFFFESYETQKDTRPLTTFTSNPGGAAAVGNMTRVLASDLNALSSFLSHELQVRDRAVRRHHEDDAGQAVPA